MVVVIDASRHRRKWKWLWKLGDHGSDRLGWGVRLTTCSEVFFQSAHQRWRAHLSYQQYNFVKYVSGTGAITRIDERNENKVSGTSQQSGKKTDKLDQLWGACPLSHHLNRSRRARGFQLSCLYCCASHCRCSPARSSCTMECLLPPAAAFYDSWMCLYLNVSQRLGTVGTSVSNRKYDSLQTRTGWQNKWTAFFSGSNTYPMFVLQNSCWPGNKDWNDPKALLSRS